MDQPLVILLMLIITLVCLVAFNLIRRMHASARSSLDVALSLASVLVAVAALAVSSVALRQESVGATGSDAPSPSGITGNGRVTINGDAGTGICVLVQGDCPSALRDPAELSQMPVKEAESLLQALPGSDLPPDVSAGPPIYLVLGTNDQGLFIRDGFTVDDKRLGDEPVVMDARPIYVDCRIDDGWLADPAAPNKHYLRTWLKIRYPEPASVGEFFVYGGYAFPVGHNGDVPRCKVDS